ncbi:peptide-binding protein [candidate division KSB1 bacterium]|nr:peptide-binding protein [candidate division KSB1 bacterium]
MWRKTFIPLILLITLCCTTCSQNNKHKKYNTEAPPSCGGALVVGVTEDVDSFNPLFSESSSGKDIIHMIMLGLADLNDKSDFSPELATRWERSKDNRQLTYYLRPDAVWSDGVPITAYDVKFTYELLKDAKVASPNQWVTDFIKSVAVVDSHTVRFTFTEAYPDQMFDTAGEFLPQHILKNVDRSAIRNHEIGQQPLASGPFKLKRWVHQQVIELEPNDKFVDGRPYLERVLFKIIPDKTNLLIQLQTGEIDMMMGVPPKEVKSLQVKRPDLKVYPISGRVYYYVGYNERQDLFKLKSIRQALTMGIPRDRLIEAILYGFGSVCNGPIPPMIEWAYDASLKGWPYNPEQARNQLEKAGWRDTDGDGWLDKAGKPFEFTLAINAGNQEKADLAVVLQDQWKKLGINISIESLEWTAFLKHLREGTFDAYLGGWSTSFNIDPTPIFHSSSTEQFNYVHYANPAVDKLIEQGRAELDREKAAAIWRKFQHEIHEDQPYTFLFWKDDIVAIHERFQSVSPIPLSAFYNIEKWYEAPEM